jgi:hypothetical protein
LQQELPKKQFKAEHLSSWRVQQPFRAAKGAFMGSSLEAEQQSLIVRTTEPEVLPQYPHEKE